MNIIEVGDKTEKVKLGQEDRVRAEKEKDKIIKKIYHPIETSNAHSSTAPKFALYLNCRPVANTTSLGGSYTWIKSVNG